MKKHLVIENTKKQLFDAHQPVDSGENSSEITLVHFLVVFLALAMAILFIFVFIRVADVLLNVLFYGTIVMAAASAVVIYVMVRKKIYKENQRAFAYALFPLVLTIGFGVCITLLVMSPNAPEGFITTWQQYASIRMGADSWLWDLFRIFSSDAASSWYFAGQFLGVLILIVPWGINWFFIGKSLYRSIILSRDTRFSNLIMGVAFILFLFSMILLSGVLKMPVFEFPAIFTDIPS